MENGVSNMVTLLDCLHFSKCPIALQSLTSPLSVFSLFNDKIPKYVNSVVVQMILHGQTSAFRTKNRAEFSTLEVAICMLRIYGVIN
jgi:hypothetical protein